MVFARLARWVARLPLAIALSQPCECLRSRFKLHLSNSEFGTREIVHEVSTRTLSQWIGPLGLSSAIEVSNVLVQPYAPDMTSIWPPNV